MRLWEAIAVVPILALLGTVSAHEGLHAKWSAFKAHHGKSYASHVEAARIEAFSANLRFIEQHNEKFARGEVTYELGLNAMSDMTPEEIRSTKFGAIVNHEARAALNATAHVMMPSAGYVDWRGRAVSGVRNQASCGSCYTFSSAGAVESTLMRKGQGEQDLSEQELVDCTYKKYWSGQLNLGCGGGDPATTIKHGLQYGMSSEGDYRYTSGQTQTQGQCRNTGRQRNLSNLRIYSVAARDENALANALQKGPIAITLNGENNEFYNYRGGIYNNPACSTQINHAVLLVGYGQQNGQEYWVIKNSWGPSWGENGFMKMAKGYNRCGIVSQDSYYVD